MDGTALVNVVYKSLFFPQYVIVHFPPFRCNYYFQLTSSSPIYFIKPYVLEVGFPCAIVWQLGGCKPRMFDQLVELVLNLVSEYLGVFPFNCN
jgi:hypothetical protein